MLCRGQLHQQCCEEWTLVSEETQAKMARMAAAAAWGLGKLGSGKKKENLTSVIAMCRVTKLPEEYY